MDLFGMEAYFIKMLTHPEVVRAVTARVCGFYLEANRRFFKQAGGSSTAISSATISGRRSTA